MRTTQSKYGRRFDEEFKRKVAELASQPGANQEQVARDLGISSYRVTRWKTQYAAAGAAPGVSTQELERENRTLRRENEDLRQPRSILNPAAVVLRRSGETCGRHRVAPEAHARAPPARHAEAVLPGPAPRIAVISAPSLPTTWPSGSIHPPASTRKTV